MDTYVNPEAKVISKEEETRVKALGFLKDKRTPDRFNCRVITRNGKVTAAEARTIAEAAERYGSGEVTMTARLTMEIQGVPFDQIEALQAFLAEAGLETGGTGAKVRPVVSCKGTTCQYGLIDTFVLSEEVHERFYHGYGQVKLPHKFKIAVGGCPNNCLKPDLNDVGIIGQRVPQVDLEKCRGCKVCQIEKNCPIGAAKLLREELAVAEYDCSQGAAVEVNAEPACSQVLSDGNGCNQAAAEKNVDMTGKIIIDETACNHCGRCVGKCPFGAVENYVNGYRICIGGRWGKKVAQGHYLNKIFTDKEEALDTVERALLLFKEQGIAGERFADTIARLGFENVEAQLIGER